VFSVIITALYVLFVLKFRAGRRWARVALDRMLEVKA